MVKTLKNCILMFCICVTGCSADIGLPYKVDYTHSLHENNFITVKNYPGYNENFEITLKNIIFDSQTESVLDSVCKDFSWFDENINNVIIYRPPEYSSKGIPSLLAIYNARTHKIDFADSGLYPKKYNDIVKVKGWCRRRSS
jgi:hypothetical protein